ncbi:hypothetical protein ACFYXH_08170 [Streptomyces sp. NPDC002730]|uniref:hypothetical protein n=1 Tax=Streptomyces sp. NPDC002730 TaxID=3364662 RepID=UPI00368A20E6
MFRMPDRTADLFGDQAIREEFEQALRAAGRFHQHQLMYISDGPFSGAVQVTVDALEVLDLDAVPHGVRRTVAGVRTLAQQLQLTGYAMGHARDVGDQANDDWPDLLGFVTQQCAGWSEQVDHDGPKKCLTRIVERCGPLVDPNQSQENRRDAYAALRHFASLFSGAAGFRREWLLRAKGVF